MTETLELNITGIAHGGVTLARHDGRVVFVSDAIPGERVRARLWESKKSFLRADTVEVVDASPERQPHVWAEAALDRDPSERAGGAEFGHIRLSHQRALKEAVVREALRRQGGIEPDSSGHYPFGGLRVEALPGDDELGGTGWRTRVTLHVDASGTVGPYAAHSHRVIPVASLPLACQALQAVAADHGWVAEIPDARFGSDAGRQPSNSADGATVSLVAPSADEVRVLLGSGETPHRSPGRSPGSRGARGGSGSAAHATRGSATGSVSDWTAVSAGSSAARVGSGSATQSGSGSAARSIGASVAASFTASPISERVGERTFQLAEGGFWQVHRLAAETLSRAVREGVDPDRFDPRAANLDLYGGVGLFAAALADGFDASLSITSVEADPTAGFFAAKNLAVCPGARSVVAHVDRFLAGQQTAPSPQERLRQAAATVVLDPPRSGAGLPVIRQLLAMHPAQIVYVACDPVAFARDAGALRVGGYELTALRAFDLFPNTHHLELVARFVPAA